MHKQLAKIYENPIVIIVDPYKNMKTTNQLALSTYELKLDPKISAIEFLNEIPHDIEIDKSEIITIESVQKNF